MNEVAASTTGPVHYLNIEYFFRLIYDAALHTHATNLNIGILLSEIWLLVTSIAYVLCLVFLGVLAYTTIFMNQLKEEEHHKYDTLEPDDAENETEHSRWKHVQSLVESPSESDWRQAIIEADIMLDDVLAASGFVGDSVGEKLKQASPQNFKTLQDAWDAHKVRNDIAHQGSAFPLTGQLAYRTIGKYRNVFEEFHLV
jgi:hypothetical protein